MVPATNASPRPPAPTYIDGDHVSVRVGQRGTGDQAANAAEAVDANANGGGFSGHG